MIVFEKNVLLDHKYTAFEFKCEVARNSPDGEKSTLKGAFLNLTQSIKAPVTMSHTLMHLSRLLQMSHLWSGWEKHKSVILFSAAASNSLTFFKPVLALRIVMVRSDDDNATRSLKRL